MADWQPGDLALCVRGSIDVVPAHRMGVSYPRQGACYVVSQVTLERFASGYRTALWLENGPRNSCTRQGVRRFDPVWPSSRFVKVTPGADIEGIEAEKRLPGKVGQDA